MFNCPKNGNIIEWHRLTGYPLHMENRENGPKKFCVRENTGDLVILPKHKEAGLLKL